MKWLMTNAIEAQIAEFDNADDKAMFMEEYVNDRTGSWSSHLSLIL